MNLKHINLHHLKTIIQRQNKRKINIRFTTNSLLLYLVLIKKINRRNSTYPRYCRDYLKESKPQSLTCPNKNKTFNNQNTKSVINLKNDLAQKNKLQYLAAQKKM